MSPRVRPTVSRGLAVRLLAGQTLVLLASALTAATVAAFVGPQIFHNHLSQAAGHVENSSESAHIETAYRDASLLSIGIALAISLVAATAVTWLLTQRFHRLLDQITHAARELTRGHYATRVPDVASGTELDTLAEAFNTMAARMEGLEDTRRRMLADLAHELRTPIAILSAHHEGLHDGITSLGPASQTVLAEQTDRLARLADDIDDVSTAEEGRLHLDLQRELITDVMWTAHHGMRERCADRGVNLVVDATDATGLTVHIDQRRIGQVMTNLLTNALRHTPSGGTITLTARRIGDEVALAVTDDGEGMIGEQLAHVFERFYRGASARTREQTGSGIGLTISKALVDAHGGGLTAASRGPGEGATFTITLPMHPR
ncbi:sensor histidine kinase [Janibacter sp. GS2]|uniref:sensor histidine kinase n=1 Tax=Janibacter sp. GS2 TaxID=3442646 RepID=UPI003EBCD044